MIDVTSLNEKLTMIVMLSRRLEQSVRWMEDDVVINKIEQQIQDLRQEILWEVEILNIENNLPNVRAPGVGYRPDMTPRYYKCIEIKE